MATASAARSAARAYPRRWPCRCRRAPAAGGAKWSSDALARVRAEDAQAFRQAVAVVQEELNRARGIDQLNQNINLAGPVVIAFGTQEQKLRMLPPMAAGQVKACFAVTEPDAGLNTTKLKFSTADGSLPKIALDVNEPIKMKWADVESLSKKGITLQDTEGKGLIVLEDTAAAISAKLKGLTIDAATSIAGAGVASVNVVDQKQLSLALADARAAAVGGVMFSSGTYAIVSDTAENISKLSAAQIIDPATVDAGGRVVFGATVELEDENTGDAVKYQIVGEDEADLKLGLINISSPIARALIGKEEGDVAEV